MYVYIYTWLYTYIVHRGVIPHFCASYRIKILPKVGPRRHYDSFRSRLRKQHLTKPAGFLSRCARRNMAGGVQLGTHGGTPNSSLDFVRENRIAWRFGKKTVFQDLQNIYNLQTYGTITLLQWGSLWGFTSNLPLHGTMNHTASLFLWEYKISQLPQK